MAPQEQLTREAEVFNRHLESGVSAESAWAALS